MANSRSIKFHEAISLFRTITHVNRCCAVRMGDLCPVFLGIKLHILRNSISQMRTMMVLVYIYLHDWVFFVFFRTNVGSHIAAPWFAWLGLSFESYLCWRSGMKLQNYCVDGGPAQETDSVCFGVMPGLQRWINYERKYEWYSPLCSFWKSCDCPLVDVLITMDNYSL